MPICNVRLQYCKHWRNLKCIVIESRPNFAWSGSSHHSFQSNPHHTPHVRTILEILRCPAFFQPFVSAVYCRIFCSTFFLAQTHKKLPKKHLGHFLYDNSGWQIEFGSIDPQAVSLFFSPAFECAYQYFWWHITKIANIGNTLQKTKL